jgi:hypothetical protein
MRLFSEKRGCKLIFHADLNTMHFQQADNVFTGELTALVGIENLRVPIIPNRCLDSINAEIGRHAVGQPPSQDASQ